MEAERDEGVASQAGSEVVDEENLELEEGDSDAPEVECEPQPTPPDHEFQVGDVVLAIHGSLLYEAKILQIVTDKPIESYVVHYQGWRMSWDETVPRDRIFIHNDINLRVAHELLRHAKSRQRRASSATGENTSKSVAGQNQDRPVAKKRAASEVLEQDDEDGAGGSKVRIQTDNDASNTQKVLFEIPAALRRHLCFDWVYISKQNKLVSLPRDYNVQRILTEWLENRRGGEDQSSREFADSLLEYFDAMLPTVLLYSFEREQLRHALDKPDNGVETPSSIYGAEHLLRLFVKLPHMLEQSSVDPALMRAIAEKANELLRYIQKNSRAMILSEYEPASSEYLAAVENNE